MENMEQLIERAKATEGGHLSIGRGGYHLHFGDGARLSGFDVEATKAKCIAAGLPVIDSRAMPIGIAAKLAVSGPMPAVGRPPSPCTPHALSYVAFKEWIEPWRQAGAEIHNMPEVSHEPAS